MHSEYFNLFYRLFLVNYISLCFNFIYFCISNNHKKSKLKWIVFKVTIKSQKISNIRSYQAEFLTYSFLLVTFSVKQDVPFIVLAFLLLSDFFEELARRNMWNNRLIPLFNHWVLMNIRQKIVFKSWQLQFINKALFGRSNLRRDWKTSILLRRKDRLWHLRAFYVSWGFIFYRVGLSALSLWIFLFLLAFFIHRFYLLLMVFPWVDCS